MSNYTFEVCIDSVQSAINAQEAGANRVELCDNLFEGGTTPSAGMIKQVRKAAPDIKLFVIIRPRGGDFVYSEDEINIMLSDIEMASQFGGDGRVSCWLVEDGDIDTANTKKLIEACNGLSFTFHRAFDMCKDPLKAIDQLASIGVNRILTSGLEQTADLGIEFIKKIILHANNRLNILVGSGIKPDNIKLIADRTQAKEFHFSARREKKSPMKFKNNRINMGGIAGIPEFSRFLSDKAIIKATINALART